jgi:hypothetical protein
VQASSRMRYPSPAWNLVVTAALMSWPAVGGAQAPAISDDSAFALVVRALAADSRYDGQAVPLQVELRPLRRLREVSAVTEETLEPPDSDRHRGRRRILAAAGLPIGDALFPRNCAGTMVQAAPGESPHSGCPSTTRVVAAIGLPRPGDAASEGALNDPHYRTVRVIVAGIGPGGISAEIRDYILEAAAHGWTAARMIIRGYVE